MTVKDFRELRVFQSAFETSTAIYELSKHWPAEERYSITDQIRRSSRSVSANIAEPWRKRRYEGAFVSKLSDADAEAGETTVWLDYARKCGFLSEERYREFFDRYDHICAQLVTMMSQSDRWCS